MSSITLYLGLDVHKEAGPCGFVIARRLHQLNVPCTVAAPSLIPKQPGSPFKTDQRDSRTIARLLRAGELTAVYVPEPTDEAIRDLCRARTDAVDDLAPLPTPAQKLSAPSRLPLPGQGQLESTAALLMRTGPPHPAMKAILEEYSSRRRPPRSTHQAHAHP
jgi:transposase